MYLFYISLLIKKSSDCGYICGFVYGHITCFCLSFLQGTPVMSLLWWPQCRRQMVFGEGWSHTYCCEAVSSPQVPHRQNPIEGSVRVSWSRQSWSTIAGINKKLVSHHAWTKWQPCCWQYLKMQVYERKVMKFTINFSECCSWQEISTGSGEVVAFDIDGLVQERRNSSALAMELHLSCTNPSIWQLIWRQYFVTPCQLCWMMFD